MKNTGKSFSSLPLNKVDSMRRKQHSIIPIVILDLCWENLLIKGTKISEPKSNPTGTESPMITDKD